LSLDPGCQHDAKAILVADSSLFIDGIYNYCDRWCERCPLTLRCRVYATEQADPGSADSRDPHNAAFWSALHHVLAQAKELITRLASDQGIDLDMVDLSDEALPGPSMDDVRQHRLATASFEYARAVADWLAAHESLLAEQHAEIETLARIGVCRPALEGTTLAIVDALDVIQWYQQQIHVKLCRALGSRQEAGQSALDGDEVADELGAAMTHDADGSAKVALIAIDRSIAAWSEMARSLPDESDMLLDFLVRLDRLRRSAEQEFPRARSFVRPGFDTE
jgi:hypothetical protein